MLLDCTDRMDRTDCTCSHKFLSIGNFHEASEIQKKKNFTLLHTKAVEGGERRRGKENNNNKESKKINGKREICTVRNATEPNAE